MESAQIAVAYGTAAVQVVGLIFIVLFRASLACSRGSLARPAFFVLLALVGGSAIGCLLSGSDGWVFSATTLWAMILGGVCDFSRWQQPTAG